MKQFGKFRERRPCVVRDCKGVTERAFCSGCWTALPAQYKAAMKQAGDQVERRKAHVRAVEYLEIGARDI